MSLLRHRQGCIGWLTVHVEHSANRNTQLHKHKYTGYWVLMHHKLPWLYWRLVCSQCMLLNPNRSLLTTMGQYNPIKIPISLISWQTEEQYNSLWMTNIHITQPNIRITIYLISWQTHVEWSTVRSTSNLLCAQFDPVQLDRGPLLSWTQVLL